MIHMMPFKPNVLIATKTQIRWMCLLVGWDWINLWILQYADLSIYLFVWKLFNSAVARCVGYCVSNCVFSFYRVNAAVAAATTAIQWLLNGWITMPISWLEIHQFHEPRTELGNLTRHFPYTVFCYFMFFPPCLALSLIRFGIACVGPAYFIKLFPIFGMKACSRQT